ncbi:MAG: transcription elongation factor GreA [bacterium]|nr:transcription elongation factor GreA [bacterium]
MREILDKLGAELKALEHEFRVELPREISTAVAMGDLRENAEYKAALERQAFVRARIGQLRERMSSLSSISMDRIPTDKAGLGSRLKVLDVDNDDERTYKLVFPEMADIAKGQLSVASPIGKAFMNCEEGDEVEVTTPSGKKRFEILEMQTVHDLEEEEKA